MPEKASQSSFNQRVANDLYINRHGMMAEIRSGNPGISRLQELDLFEAEVEHRYSVSLPELLADKSAAAILFQSTLLRAFYPEKYNLHRKKLPSTEQNIAKAVYDSRKPRLREINAEVPEPSRRIKVYFERVNRLLKAFFNIDLKRLFQHPEAKRQLQRSSLFNGQEFQDFQASSSSEQRAEAASSSGFSPGQLQEAARGLMRDQAAIQKKINESLRRGANVGAANQIFIDVLGKHLSESGQPSLNNIMQDPEARAILSEFDGIQLVFPKEFAEFQPHGRPQAASSSRSNVKSPVEMARELIEQKNEIEALMDGLLPPEPDRLSIATAARIILHQFMVEHRMVMANILDNEEAKNILFQIPAYRAAFDDTFHEQWTQSTEYQAGRTPQAASSSRSNVKSPVEMARELIAQEKEINTAIMKRLPPNYRWDEVPLAAEQVLSQFVEQRGMRVKELLDNEEARNILFDSPTYRAAFDMKFRAEWSQGPGYQSGAAPQAASSSSQSAVVEEASQQQGRRAEETYEQTPEDVRMLEEQKLDNLFNKIPEAAPLYKELMESPVYQKNIQKAIKNEKVKAVREGNGQRVGHLDNLKAILDYKNPKLKSQFARAIGELDASYSQNSRPGRSPGWR